VRNGKSTLKTAAHADFTVIHLERALFLLRVSKRNLFCEDEKRKREREEPRVREEKKNQQKKDEVKYTSCVREHVKREGKKL
jgi:hypothetical protein